MTFGQTVDAVVQQNHVQVDVTAYGVDEVITADGQTVTVAGDLPYRQVGIGNLAPVEMAAARPWMVCSHTYSCNRADGWNSRYLDDGCSPKELCRFRHCFVQEARKKWSPQPDTNGLSFYSLLLYIRT